MSGAKLTSQLARRMAFGVGLAVFLLTLLVTTMVSTGHYLSLHHPESYGRFIAIRLLIVGGIALVGALVVVLAVYDEAKARR